MIQHTYNNYVCNLFEHQPVIISKVKYINYLKAGALLNFELLKKTNVRQSSVQHNKLVGHDGLSLYNNYDKKFIQELNSSRPRHKCFTNWDTPYETKGCRLQTRDQRNERSGEWGE